MITIFKDDINKCYQFATDAWVNDSQSKKSNGTIKRSKEEFISNQFTGKLAEIIFKKTVELAYPQYQIELDFNHYQDKHHIDNGDVKVIKNSTEITTKIDIKSSSKQAKWLLVEDFKYDDTINEYMKSDKYVMVQFEDDILFAKNIITNFSKLPNLTKITGKVTGWISHSNFISKKENQPWFIFHTGKTLYNPYYLPAKLEKLNDKKHLVNYYNKAFNSEVSKNPSLQKFLNVDLKAKINYGFPIKWLNDFSEDVFKL